MLALQAPMQAANQVGVRKAVFQDARQFAGIIAPKNCADILVAFCHE